MNINPILRAQYEQQRQKEAERIRYINRAERARQRLLGSAEGRVLGEITKTLRVEIKR